jgi:hypothetical protein
MFDDDEDGGNGFHPIMNIIGGEEANIALQKKRTNL